VRQYQRRMLEIRGAFATGASGAATVAARAAAVDELIVGLWTRAVAETPVLGQGIAVLAVGGYGRRELFPYSDVTCCPAGWEGFGGGDQAAGPAHQPAALGLRDPAIAGDARRSEAERFERGEMPEFTIALLTTGCWRETRRSTGGWRRWVSQDAGAGEQGAGRGLVQLTSERHAKYGDTPFHLEPSIKTVPAVCGRACVRVAAAAGGGGAGSEDGGVGWRGWRVGERPRGVSPGGGVSV